MKESQKGFIIPLILAIIAILVIGGGVYVYLHKTTNWKTYINTRYNYQIQHPDNSTVDIKDLSSVNIESPVKNGSVDINISDIASIDGCGLLGPGIYTVIATGTVVINNKTYNTIGTISDGNIYRKLGGAYSKDGTRVYFFVSMDGLCIGYGYTIGEGEPSIEQGDIDSADSLVKQIISTFKFTNPTSTTSTDETANWKTYKNDKYGFEFKYPENMNVTPFSVCGPICVDQFYINELDGARIVEVLTSSRKNIEEYLYDLQNSQGSNFTNIEKDFYNLGKAIFHYSNSQQIVCGDTYQIILHNGYEFGFFDRDSNCPNESQISKILSTFKFTK